VSERKWQVSSLGFGLLSIYLRYPFFFLYRGPSGGSLHTRCDSAVQSADDSNVSVQPRAFCTLGPYLINSGVLDRSLDLLCSVFASTVASFLPPRHLHRI
jgi:hypothetical protein